MKQNLPDSYNYKNFIDQNLRMPSLHNDISKIFYLSKIKSSILSHDQSKIKAEQEYKHKYN